jgi:mannosyltransferase
LTAPLHHTIRETAFWVWRSTRLFAFALLLTAMVVGAHLRFHRLAHFDMTGDEGASWAGASAASAEQVAKAERRLDPGKLALYDLVLHEWIGLFGDSLFAMRSMSAALGTIAIVLIFVTVREVCRSLGDEPAAAVGELAGAFAALLYATNLQMVVSDRTVRMYPLAMCAELLQLTFFVRAQRRGGMLNYGGTAVFTAAMVSSNFTSTFLMVAEALWLGGLLLGALWAAPSRRLLVVGPSCALVAGITILMPWWHGAFKSSRGGAKYFIDWIKLQPISWPYTTLRDSTGDHTLFWILVALAAFGVWQQWRSARLVVEFFAMWTASPILAVLAVTYLIHPLEVPRYVLIAFVGMFALAAFGAASMRSTALRIVLAVLLIHLSVRPVHVWVRHFHGVAWRGASLLAAQETAPGQQIAVFPLYCINVVRFYMPPERRGDVAEANQECSAARILLIDGWDRASLAAAKAKMDACYPRILAHMQMVEVRAR